LIEEPFMLRSAFFLALFSISVGAPAAGPGKYNKVLGIGDPAPAWEELEGTDGRKHSLADLKNKDVVVVVFTCNSCPVAAGYEDRIQAFAARYAKSDGKVEVVAINVNTGKDDALPAMKARAEKKGLTYSYLFDPTQAIARKYGATFTPEFFVLDKDRKVVYSGAMDDKAPPGEPKLNYLEAAVQAVLAGKPSPTAETSAAAGCKIKFNPKADE
jgi:peroxiredoxin